MKPVSFDEVVFQASCMVRDMRALTALANSDNPCEELRDGTLLQVRRARRGFRIAHVDEIGRILRSWLVDRRGKLITSELSAGELISERSKKR